AGGQGRGRPAPRRGSELLQRETKVAQGARFGGARPERHPDHGEQGPDVARPQLVPDTGRAPSRPAHGGAEEDAADDRGRRLQGKLHGARESGPEDEREQGELDGDRQTEGLDLGPRPVEEGEKTGVQAEGAGRGAVAERDPDEDGSRHAERAHGRSPSTSGSPRARHSETPSSSATARYPRARSSLTASG